MDLRSLTWLSYISLVLNGFVLNALGPVMPIVIKEYGLTLAAAGTVLHLRVWGGCCQFPKQQLV